MSGEVLEGRKPGTRPRVSSAKARLTTPPEQTPWDDGQVMQEYQQRVKSAALIRDAHTRTGKSMFRPPSEKKAEKQERYSTSYSNHYTGTAVRPPSARPSSPTRRNNPHPTQQFMTWKVPSRNLGMPLSQLLRDSQKTFQNDYLDDEYPDDPNEEILTSLSRLKFPPTEPSSKDYGQALLKQRQSIHAQGGTRPPSMGQMRGHTPAEALSSDILFRTVKGDSVNAFDIWLQNAPPQEQDTVLRMLKAAEDAQVEESLLNCMQPSAAEAVKKWMRKAPEGERDVVARLFSSMGQRQRPPSREAPELLHRSRSFSDGQYHPPPSREQPRPLGRPRSARTSSRLSRRPSAPTPMQSLRPPGVHKQGPGVIWHHQSSREPPTKVYHRGSIFGMPTHMRGSHFTIHPEWPEYYPVADT